MNKILIADQVQVMFDNTPNVLPHVKAGVDAVAASSEYFTDFPESEVARWARVVQDAHIKAD